jgi:hypothetical protein
MLCALTCCEEGRRCCLDWGFPYAYDSEAVVIVLLAFGRGLPAMKQLHALVSVRCLFQKSIIRIVTSVCRRSDVTRRAFILELQRLKKGVLGL